jgi:GntR family transcriptional regulator / MocR family aminotransferase
VTGVPAGLQVFVRLADGVDEAEVLRAAAQRGVHVEQTARHWAGRGAPFPALLIGFGTVHESSIEAGVKRLAEAVRSVS